MPALYAGEPSNTAIAVMSPSIDLNGDADAVVAPFLALAHLRVFLRIEKAGMRIERAEHAADRAVDEAIRFDLVDVVGFDRAQRGGERAIVIGDLVVGRERAASEQAADEGGYDNREGHGGQGTVASHDQNPSR